MVSRVKAAIPLIISVDSDRGSCSRLPLFLFEKMKILQHIYRFPAFLCLVSALFLASSRKADAQQVAIRANALNWALCTPDIGLEIVTGEHTSVGLSAFGHYRPYGMDSRILVFQPEFRYWFNGRPMTREYVGVTAFAATYDMTVRSQVYDGDALALGLTGGYVFTLGKRWNFELSGGFGVLAFRQKQYYNHDNYDDYFVEEAVKVNSWGYKLFPVKLGVSFIYIIK